MTDGNFHTGKNGNKVREYFKLYKCATSAAWVEEAHLAVKVQIIDTYFGVLDMHFSFHDNLVGVRMLKTAEDFLNEYQGFAGGVCKE